MMMQYWRILTVVLLGTSAAAGELTMSWSQLSLPTCGVDRFLADHPEWDGRGVVIAVLDTGVDPTIPGLDLLPDGSPKVIDVQDFSGEGNVEMHRVRAKADGDAVIDYDDAGAAITYALPDLSDRDRREYLFGFLEEKQFANAPVPDLNDSGTTDDRFAMLVTYLPGDGDDDALFFIDSNLDRSFTDEAPLRNYRVDQQSFTLERPAPESQIVPLAFQVNVFLRKREVVLHFDDGAHGTHVAGIAAGYRINRQDGFHGVAPGAWLMSLKIGNNNDAGGISTTDAKKRAMEYAARYAREHGVPVVCNLSYGIASVIEGDSAIDTFYDDILTRNPYLIFCTSAGNIGPGLSSVGTPAAANLALTIGALLAPDSARDVQGYDIPEAVPTVFTSRGGEITKPDIATPGWSTSTVPRWVTRGDYWAGTSMASPYASGLCALLISAAQQSNVYPVRAWDLKRALWLSAKLPASATVHDVGFGIPEVNEAWSQLQSLAKSAADDPVIGYAIETESPMSHDGSAPAAYWRSTWYPSGQEQQRFQIRPIFAPHVDKRSRTGFTRKFRLKSLADWCLLTQETCYLRGEQSAQVFVTYDASRLAEPGWYVGDVEAVDEDTGQIAFRLRNTVIVPQKVTDQPDRSWRMEAKADGWNTQRHFVAVPPGASVMQVTLSAPSDAKSRASLERIYDPHGHQLRDRGARLNSDAGKREVTRTFDDRLVPGVWEIDVVADRPDRVWPYALMVRFFGLHADPKRITECKAADEQPSGSLTVTNLFDMPLSTKAEGRIEGFRKHKTGKFEGLRDTLTYKVDLGAEHSGLRLDLRLDEEHYAEVTDIHVAVEDANGDRIHDSGFSDHHFLATARHPKPGSETTITVRITAGFAISDDQRETPMEVNLDYLLTDPVGLEVTHDEASEVRFVPAAPVKIAFEATQRLPNAPEGTQPVGYVLFRERYSNDEALRVPIEIDD